MSDIIKTTKSHRFHYMDGIRGIASLAVCLWHNFLAFFPGSVMPSIKMQVPILERYIYRSPIDIFFAGDFAVFIFFMLSGFVISVKFFGECNAEALKKAFFRRYVRLMPPALATVMLSYFLLKTGFMFNQQAGGIANSWWLKLNWSEVSPTVYNALHYGLYDLWFVGTSAAGSYNSNLGTLLIELLGSYMIFMAIYVAFALKLSVAQRYIFHAVLIYLAFVLLPGDPHYAVFFFGMAAADVYQNSQNVYVRLRRYGVPILLLGWFLGAANIGNLPFWPYHLVEIAFRSMNLHPLTYPWALGAILLVLGVMLVPSTHHFLENRFCQILGEYSFALYVTHTVFLGSVTCFLFTKLSETHRFSYGITVLLSFLIAAPFLVLATHLVKKVDDWAIGISRKI